MWLHSPNLDLGWFREIQSEHPTISGRMDRRGFQRADAHYGHAHYLGPHHAAVFGRAD
jgi:hypothetical protein